MFRYLIFPLLFCFQDDPTRQAEQAAIDARRAESARMAADIAAIKERLAKLEAVKPPVPPAPAPNGRRLVGGLRLTGPYARAALAVDFASKRLWIAGHVQRNEVMEFALPEIGTGTDPATWPILKPTRTIPGWWTDEGYCNGLAFFRGKLWCAPRSGYDTSPPEKLTLYAQDGEKLIVPLPRQQFAGFVKRMGQEPFLGCGGYESGQGSARGPTLASLDGKQVFIRFDWTTSWEGRELRPANYWPENHVNSWLALEPRNGEGRWACDRINGGGLVLADGITYWPQMGTGDIVYSRQTPTFGSGAKTYRYRYDPATYKLIGWEETDLGKVAGQELDPQGRVWLAEVGGWASGSVKEDPVIRVYE